ncbi:MAG: Calx-beta domain-containing protein [Pirellulaceae bacterium]
MISGPNDILEPTLPGTPATAQFTISAAPFSYGESGNVDWATEAVSGGATPGEDFTVSSGTVYLSYQNSSVQVTVPILYDEVSEPLEAFRVVLSNPTGSLAIMQGSHTTSIRDNNPPPDPPPPWVPTVNFALSAHDPILEGQSRVLTLVRNMAGPALTVSYVIAEDSAATDADVTLSPAGSVTFAAGQTTANLSLTAIDDSTIEVYEYLKLALVPYPAPNQGPGAYLIGQPGEALLKIRDNDEVIFSDLTVDWRTPDDTWQNSPDNEMLWQEDDLRWTVTLPSQEVPFRNELSDLTLLKRPHDDPGLGWGPINPQSVVPNPQNPAQFFIYANPLVGDWDITVTGVFDAVIRAWLVAPKHRPAEGVVSTKWVKPVFDPGLRLGVDGDDAIWMDPKYFGPRIYPEFNLPPEHVPNQNDHSNVDIEVTLAMPVPAGWVADLYLKDFDVDHVYNATRSEDVGSGYLDPNDDIVDNPNYPNPAPSPIGSDNTKTLRRKPNDNRDGFGGYAKGGDLESDHMVFQASQTVKTVGYTIYIPQPGNNYRVSVSGHLAYINAHTLSDDGISILSGPTGGFAVASNRVTDTLTVWRTLHIERDSMGKPNASDTFNQDQPFDDLPPSPWNLRDADISMLAEWFLPANIDVIADLATYDVKDGTDPNFFMHNIEGPDLNSDTPQGAAFARFAAMKDVANSTSFWSVQVIGAYEGSILQDFDDPQPEDVVLGTTRGGAESPFSVIYLETIRDFTRYISLRDYPRTFGGETADERARICEKRVTVHEVAHNFFGGHGNPPTDAANTGIMDKDILLYGSNAENRFTPRQLGRLQSRIKPDASP